MSEVEPFELIKVSDIDETETEEWLVTDLWAAQGCGIIGGEPKTCKSLLSLDIAVSVASGTPCLGKFTVPEKGTVLIYPAEDRLRNVKNRVLAVTQSRGLNLEDLPIEVFREQRLSIEKEDDQEKLWDTVEKAKPKLLILDPLRRISGADENSSNEISRILNFLKAMQEDLGTGICLVHHSRKPNYDGMGRGGRELRGSSDLFSWTESLITITKDTGNESVTVKTEHRYAPPGEPFRLDVIEDENGTRLKMAKIKASGRKAKPSLRDRRGCPGLS